MSLATKVTGTILFAAGLMFTASTAQATYVGNDPINNTDPFGKQAVTVEEQRAVTQGDLDKFWQSRTERGDPIGQLGQDFGKPASEQPADVFMSTGRLEFEIAENIVSDTPADQIQDIDPLVAEGLANVRQDLAEAHVDAVNKDTKGQKQFLSARDITKYHHDVFKEHNIPKNTFGGTPITGLKIEDRLTRAIWCNGCDKK